MDQWSPVSDAVPPAPTLCPGASAVRQISPRVADAVLQAFNNHRLMGIRQKILLILAVVLVVSLTIHGWLILEEQREEALADLQHRGSDISHFLAKAVACSVIGYDYHPLQLLMNEIVATDAGILKNTMAYQWQGRGLRILYASPALPPYNIAARADLDPRYDGFVAATDQEYDVVRRLIAPFMTKPR